MNRDNREQLKIHHAYGAALRGAIDDVVGSKTPLSVDDVVDIVKARLDVVEHEFKKALPNE